MQRRLVVDNDNNFVLIMAWLMVMHGIPSSWSFSSSMMGLKLEVMHYYEHQGSEVILLD